MNVLTREDIEEMCRLRQTMPHIWSIGGLAEWFGCSRRTVMYHLTKNGIEK